MEHYSQQTSGWKPICITDVVIHGNVCDLSTKADEDPKINACMPAPASQTLISSPSPRQGKCVANGSDSVSCTGELWTKCRSESRRGARMRKCTSQHLPLCQEVRVASAHRAGVWYESGMFWKRLTGASLGGGWNM